MKPRIVCSAIRAKDGDVLLGIRHYSHDMVVQIQNRKDGDKFHHLSGTNQGFVDQFGKYYTRQEAWIIAKDNNQIARDIDVIGTLYSEHLY